MKKINILSALTFLIFAFNLSSCSTDVEPVDPMLLEQINDDGVVIGNPDTGDDGSGVITTTNDYWPMAVNNEWNFVKESKFMDPMKIVSTQKINGITYYKFNNMFGESSEGNQGEASVWTRKDNGNYFVRQELIVATIPGQPKTTQTPMELIILKDNIDVARTWTQNVTQTTTIEGFPPIETVMNVTGKILEKNVTINVKGIAYENVIKVELIQNTSGTIITNYYWFAKGIGPIKIINKGTGFEENKELSSYKIN